MEPPYRALLTFHLLAVAVFLGGLFLNAATLPGMAAKPVAELTRARRMNGFVTTPALALVWLLGLSLAAQGGWFVAGWLQAKIVMVVLLSALHGVFSARLRRIGQPAAPTPGYGPLLLAAVLATAIIGLVTAKPG